MGQSKEQARKTSEVRTSLVKGRMRLGAVERSIPMCSDLSGYGPHRLMCLHTWSIGSGIIEGVPLLEKVWPYWRKCITVVVGFVVS